MKELKLKIGTVISNEETVDGVEVNSILGIPYASATRFGMPKIIESYDNITPINAGKGVRFPQQDVPPLLNKFMKNPMMRPEILTNADETTEDAFILNIWTSGVEDKKPVLVFIHGGGFSYGSGTTPLYNGRYLASKGIVTVNINYRLGVPGFLPVVIDGELSANRGFYDQQCALIWIKKHIGEFGGDENNITLMGQSAGGMSAFTQFLSQDSSDYFDRLIVCSAGAPKCKSEDSAIKIWEAFKSNNKIADVSMLEQMPAKKLIKLKLPLQVASSPVMDGKLMKKNSLDLMKAGEFPNKPVLIGSTHDEMRMIANKSWYKSLGVVTDEEAFQDKCKNLYGELGTKLAEELREEARDLPDLQFKMIEIPMFHTSVLEALEYISQKNKIYGYRMCYVPNAWNGLRGAYHCSELPFFFGTIKDMDYVTSDDNMRQMELLQNEWIEFIKTGNISSEEAYNKDNKVIIYEGTGTRMETFPHKELIQEISESDLLEKIQKDFMRGRDDNFIA